MLVLASLSLSWWAIHSDPVVNADAVGELIAAKRFAEGAWRPALQAAGRPLYALLIGSASRLTGASVEHAAYALNAGLFALLTVGFVALVNTVGAEAPGGPPATWLAAVVALTYPALNGFRSFVSGDAGYWAFYVWSLAWFLHWVEARDRRSLWLWFASASAALLFSLEVVVFLLIVPAWWWVSSAKRRRGILRVLVLVAAFALLVCYTSWRHTWHSEVAGLELLRHPVGHLMDGLHDAAQGVRFKLEGLRSAFLNQFSSHYDALALLTTLAALVAKALLEALGSVYAALAGYAWFTLKRTLPAATRYWWGVFAVLAAMVMLAPSFTEFEVTRRQGMVAALTLSAAIPLGLERLRRLRSEGGGLRWVLPLALLLMAVTGIRGLDLGTRDAALRHAGLWLRARADAGSTLYSNSPVIDYYSGLEAYRPGSKYTWQEAMRTVWSGRWRDYDYLAVAIPHTRPYRKGILMRDIKHRPLKVLSDGRGDRVLIFKSGH